MAARLPKTEINLGKFNGVEETFKRLGKASGVDVVFEDSGAQGELSGDLGAMPVEKAWRHLLSAAGLTARLDGDKIVLSQAEPRQQEPRRRAVTSTTCTAR